MFRAFFTFLPTSPLSFLQRNNMPPDLGLSLLLGQVLTAEQQSQAWTVFLNWGVVGIIAFVSLSFVLSIFVFIAMVLRKAIVTYGPRIVDKAVTTMDTLRESQLGIIETQKKQVENSERLISLHINMNKRSDDTIKTLFEPTGKGFENHNFSATRVEECLLRGLDAIEEHLREEPDETIRVRWGRHIASMRDSLRHKV